MAPGFDQICMSRPRIIYLDLAPAAVSPSLLWHGATRCVARRRPGLETRRGAFEIIGERRRVREDRENVELKWKTWDGKSVRWSEGGG